MKSERLDFTYNRVIESASLFNIWLIYLEYSFISLDDFKELQQMNKWDYIRLALCFLALAWYAYYIVLPHIGHEDDMVSHLYKFGLPRQ